jgi:hypothetical protein
MPHKMTFVLLAPCLFCAGVAADVQEPAPPTFPNFTVPGAEDVTEPMRDLFRLHYPAAGPKATLWDEWLSSPSLWPAVEGSMEAFRAQWRQTLTERIIDPEGYVATHQHASIAHPLGWPFPFWGQGSPRSWGWHFSLSGVPRGWHHTEAKTQEGWIAAGLIDEGIDDDAWNLNLSEPFATVTTPLLDVLPLEAPMLQMRWRATGLGNAQPYVEWATRQAPEFSAARRFHFEPIESEHVVFTVIPIHRHPEWAGEITQLRIGFGNNETGAKVGIQALFTQFDTRHNINNGNFTVGCATYFNYTRDLNFLRAQINRMRIAIRYVMTEYEALERGVIFTPYVGHDGRSGLRWDEGPTEEIGHETGKKSLLSGVGVGNNYWDLMPFGHLDVYATMLYYNALGQMLQLEQAVRDHPEWNIPGGALALDPDELAVHRARVKKVGNDLFWNPETQRFAPIDSDGTRHDYGLTFLNLEAIHYDFATAEHAAAIMAWITGRRIVDGDTSQGADIYHWRFGPRATTKRNVEYYGWFWSGPETIFWGGQVQDGGAVLGFSYHDLMARLRVLGPDNVLARLEEIAAWYREVRDAGGYRKYYEGKEGVSLQGGGTAGGLGLDHEFFESVLVPQIFFDGFLGFEARADGFALNPRLPASWPSLEITRIRVHDAIVTVTVTHEGAAVRVDEVLSPLEPELVVQIRDQPHRLSLRPGETLAIGL